MTSCSESRKIAPQWPRAEQGRAGRCAGGSWPLATQTRPGAPRTSAAILRPQRCLFGNEPGDLSHTRQPPPALCARSLVPCLHLLIALPACPQSACLASLACRSCAQRPALHLFCPTASATALLPCHYCHALSSICTALFACCFAWPAAPALLAIAICLSSLVRILCRSANGCHHAAACNAHDPHTRAVMFMLHLLCS